MSFWTFACPVGLADAPVGTCLFIAGLALRIPEVRMADAFPRVRVALGTVEALHPLALVHRCLAVRTFPARQTVAFVLRHVADAVRGSAAVAVGHAAVRDLLLALVPCVARVAHALPRVGIAVPRVAVHHLTLLSLVLALIAPKLRWTLASVRAHVALPSVLAIVMRVATIGRDMLALRTRETRPTLTEPRCGVTLPSVLTLDVLAQIYSVLAIVTFESLVACTLAHVHLAKAVGLMTIRVIFAAPLHLHVTVGSPHARLRTATLSCIRVALLLPFALHIRALVDDTAVVSHPSFQALTFVRRRIALLVLATVTIVLATARYLLITVGAPEARITDTCTILTLSIASTVLIR